MPETIADGDAKKVANKDARAVPVAEGTFTHIGDNQTTGGADAYAARHVPGLSFTEGISADEQRAVGRLGFTGTVTSVHRRRDGSVARIVGTNLGGHSLGNAGITEGNITRVDLTNRVDYVEGTGLGGNLLEKAGITAGNVSRVVINDNGSMRYARGTNLGGEIFRGFTGSFTGVWLTGDHRVQSLEGSNLGGEKLKAAGITEGNITEVHFLDDGSIDYVKGSNLGGEKLEATGITGDNVSNVNFYRNGGVELVTGDGLRGEALTKAGITEGNVTAVNFFDDGSIAFVEGSNLGGEKLEATGITGHFTKVVFRKDGTVYGLSGDALRGDKIAQASNVREWIMDHGDVGIPQYSDTGPTLSATIIATVKELRFKEDGKVVIIG